MREATNNIKKNQIEILVDSLIREDSEATEAFANVLTGGDGILNTRIRVSEEPFVLAVIEESERVRGVIRNRYSGLALKIKSMEEYYTTYGYRGFKDFVRDQKRRIKKGIVLSAVYINSKLLNDGVAKKIQKMNKVIAKSVTAKKKRIYSYVNAYSHVNIFTEKDLQNALNQLTEAQVQNRKPLSLLLTSHQNYSIMGDVGTEFFGNIRIEGVSMFDPIYIPKGVLDNYIREGNLEKLMSDVIIFNLVCSQQALDHPMKLGLLERLIQANPSALYIAMVNSPQYDQMMDRDGEYRIQYLRLRKMVDEEELFRLFRLTGEKLQLSTTNKDEYETYFNALWQDHRSHFLPFWARLSKARPIGIVPTHTIIPIKGAKEEDIKELYDERFCEVATSINTRDYTTIKIGGIAQAVVYPNTVEDIQKIIKFCNNKNISYWVLGNGSDLVLAENIPGIVILTSGVYNYTIDDKEATITAQCGAPMFGYHGLVKQAYRHGLSGLEYAVNIPANVGGLVAANASYRMVTGEEMSTADVVKLVRALDPNGNKVELKPNELNFTYKDSKFQNEYWNWVIYEVVFQLIKKDQVEIHERTRQIGFDRFVKKHQPRYTEYPSAGSAYRLRAPYIVGGATYTAAELISGAGCLKFNKRDNPLKLHERCPNFIINTGNATFSDVKELMTDIDFAVYDTYGVHLIPEIQVKPNQPIVKGVSLEQLRYRR